MNSNSMFTCISTAGNAFFLSGQTLVPAQRDARGPYPYLRACPASIRPPPSITRSAQSSAAMKTISSPRNTKSSSSVRFRHNPCWSAPWRRQAWAEWPMLRSISTRFRASSWIIRWQFPANGGAHHSGRASLGVTRQIFYVQLGSFDTHNNQAQIHAQLLTQLGAAFQYFDGLMVGMGLGSNVTSFTISDFGRTLTCNSNGTDHGWGSHHFVVGGAVQAAEYVRAISRRRRRSGQRPRRGPPDSYYFKRAIRGHPCAVVRPLRRGDPRGFPNFGNFGSDPYLGFMG